MKKIIVLSAILAVAFTGCWRSSSSKAQGGPQSAYNAPVMEGLTDFSFRLYRQLSSGNQSNVLFSPLSISSAISMAYVGSRDETAIQIARVMGYPGSVDLVARGFGWLTDYLSPGGDTPYQLMAANGLFLQTGFELQSHFSDLMSGSYQGEFFRVDFEKDPEAAREQANGWVSKQTAGKIDQLVPSGAVNEATRLLLVSSLYMKAPWSSPFSSQSTQAAPFYPLGGGSVQVPMMRQRGTFPYYKGTGFSFLKLPYAAGSKGPRLAMLLLMPDNPKHFHLVEKRITPKALRAGLGRLQMRQVDVGLPRFSLKTDLPLSNVLSSMGMQVAFSNRADFSGINGERDLMLQSVMHGVTLDVDEAGTEAAAATSVAIGVKSMPMGQPVRFWADHPFLFMIIDEQSGAILFMGRYARP